MRVSSILSQFNNNSIKQCQPARFPLIETLQVVNLHLLLLSSTIQVMEINQELKVLDLICMHIMNPEELRNKSSKVSMTCRFLTPNINPSSQG